MFYLVKWRLIVAVCYNNLWKLLIDRNMNKTELKESAGVSFNVMARMGKNETVSIESIEKICIALQHYFIIMQSS